MGFAWQLQDAKNKFSEVVDKAISVGPQEITRHGKKTAVVLSIHDYRRLKTKRGSLVDFFQSSPLKNVALVRNKDLPRDVTL